jgi:TorA maturation chaperone TorD
MSLPTTLSAVDAARLHAFRQGVALDLRLLASLHNVHPGCDTLAELHRIGFPGQMHLRLRTQQGESAVACMETALNELGQNPSAQTMDWLAADHADIYLLHALRASPEESVWFNEEGCMRQEAMFQVRNWYQKYHLGAADWRNRADDHLVLQITFCAHLLSQDSGESLQDCAQFLDEHLLRWIERFAQRVVQRCATSYFAGLAVLTVAYLQALRQVLAQVLDEPIPSAQEIEKRMAPVVEPELKPVHFVPGVNPSW